MQTLKRFESILQKKEVLMSDPIYEECESCAGGGWIDIGDPEEGVTDDCPQCGGTGLIEVE